MLGLSAGTVITKKQWNQTIEFSRKALLFGCIVSFVIRYRCLGTKENKTLNRILVTEVK